jgi:hypothetical protein
MTSPRLIVNLGTEKSGISEVMAGPWQDIRVTQVAAGESTELSSGDAEHAGFIVGGTGTITSVSGERFRLAPGVAFAIPVGGSVVLATDAGLELLHVIMNVARR